MTLFFLPGFLGTYSGTEAVTPPQSLQAPSLEEYGDLFNQFAAHYPAPRTVIGYSMGGRQALHALIANPSLYEKVILVSSHPGLKSDPERKARCEKDARWAERFLSEPWEPLMASWNAQPVFQGSEMWHREEKDYQREKLSHELLAYSLGKQKDLRNEMEKHADQILFVRGELDPFPHELPSSIQKIILQGKGHRINFPLILEQVIAKLPPR